MQWVRQATDYKMEAISPGWTLWHSSWHSSRQIMTQVMTQFVTQWHVQLTAGADHDYVPLVVHFSVEDSPSLPLLRVCGVEVGIWKKIINFLFEQDVQTFFPLLGHNQPSFKMTAIFWSFFLSLSNKLSNLREKINVFTLHELIGKGHHQICIVLMGWGVEKALCLVFLLSALFKSFLKK